MKKIKFLLLCVLLFNFLAACEPEVIPTESFQNEKNLIEIYSDTGEDGGPIDDKKDKG
ncbi:hypothetical protein [Antarcticibacterium arcticum]|uniref:hypothetical protein n=1 Tax=Antarcticibacterium arcticum TaxID=2585771 RepID=UPI00143D09F4|nr:hypothetical protein [Antarcticibacterium arcticum]